MVKALAALEELHTAMQDMGKDVVVAVVVLAALVGIVLEPH